MPGRRAGELIRGSDCGEFGFPVPKSSYGLQELRRHALLDFGEPLPSRAVRNYLHGSGLCFRSFWTTGCVLDILCGRTGHMRSLVANVFGEQRLTRGGVPKKQYLYVEQPVWGPT